MRKLTKINLLLDEALCNADAFESIETIVQSKLMPRVANEEDFQKLPLILKRIIYCRSLIIASGVTGLSGLFADSTINRRLDRILESVEAVSAFDTLAFLQDLRKNLPNGRFPSTSEEARCAEELVSDAEETPNSPNCRLRELVKGFSDSISSLPFDLQQYLIKNQVYLSAALLGLDSKN